MNHEAHSSNTPSHMGKSHYRRLMLMTAMSFIAMYILMYAMVNVIGNAHPNLNQLYMAGLMAASMVVIEITVMSGMYREKKLNAIVGGMGVAALIAFFLLIRTQTAISDRQFLRSMIPHHASAILMCQRASIHVADIQRLCQDIVSSQQREIDLMKALLREPR